MGAGSGLGAGATMGAGAGGGGGGGGEEHAARSGSAPIPTKATKEYFMRISITGARAGYEQFRLLQGPAWPSVVFATEIDFLATMSGVQGVGSNAPELLGAGPQRPVTRSERRNFP